MTVRELFYKKLEELSNKIISNSGVIDVQEDIADKMLMLLKTIKEFSHKDNILNEEGDSVII